MDDKIKKAAEEVIAEHYRLPEEVQVAVGTLSERHSYSAHLDAHHAVRNLFGHLACSKTDLLIFSGYDITGPGGRVTLPIQSLMCGAATEGLDRNTSDFVIIRTSSFVATARGSIPRFLTANTHSTPKQVPANYFLIDRDGNDIPDGSFLDDVAVEVMAWQNDGSPAGRARFFWICTVEVARQVSLGG